ncbi:hypothetical protein QJS10_CPA06g01887 [Acorus calamus]|uniref:Uncharacterized protein n=1 Tax=Acorus calamus TaxID=4465 RepID=A0AAV9EJ63_ACOCL|nr:hypothetical protein QJS10_CPA06g01887 [Acorus calamus]
MAYPSSMKNLFVLVTLVTLVVLLQSSKAPAEAKIIGGRTKFMENDLRSLECIQTGCRHSIWRVRRHESAHPHMLINMNFARRTARVPKPKFDEDM